MSVFTGDDNEIHWTTALLFCAVITSPVWITILIVLVL